MKDKDITNTEFWDAEERIRMLRSGELDDILGVVGAPYEELMAKRSKAEFHTKAAIVKQMHVGKRGHPLAISTTTKKGVEYFYTKIDGKPICCQTYEGLIDKLYCHYGGDALKNPHTVAYYFDCYIRDYIECHPANEKTISNTRAEYARFIDEELANMDVRDITPKYLEKYSIKLVTRLSLKVSAFKNYKSLLNNIFQAAIEDMIICQNPAKGMNNKTCYSMCDQSLRSCLDYDEKLISEEEMYRIEAELARRREFHKRYGENSFYLYDIMILIHAEIGCRPGELCAIKLTDIKAEDFHIHSMIDSEGRYRQFTKNEKGESRGGRLFPITPRAAELLAELSKRKARCGIVSEFLFCNEKGEHLKSEKYTDVIRDVFRAAQVPGKTSYAFRRTVNNRLEENDFTSSERALLLGHTPDTNLKYYTNPRKNATLTKFKEVFCDRSTLGLPKNVVPFDSKKSPRTANSPAF